MIFGKPIYYYFGNSSLTLSGIHDVGQFYVAGSSNILINDITGEQDGITLALSNDSRIMNVNINTSGEEGYGIFVHSNALNTTVQNNIIRSYANSGIGVYVYSGSDDTTLLNNTLITSQSYAYGAYVRSSGAGRIRDRSARTG